MTKKSSILRLVLLKLNLILFSSVVKLKVPLVIEEAAKFVIVLSGPLIVLLVNVAVSSCKTTVPVAFGKLTVLSAVGSITVKVVSKSSEVVPSKVNEFVTSIVVEFTVVVVPLTVKSPDTVKLLPIVTLLGKP